MLYSKYLFVSIYLYTYYHIYFNPQLLIYPSSPFPFGNHRFVFCVSLLYLVAQSCLTLWDHTHCILPGSSVHGILQVRILEWVARPSSRESSQPRDLTPVSHITGGFFTIWAIREADEYWSRKSIPSLGELPNPEIKPGSPALQVDSLPAELPGKWDKRR